MAARNDNSPDVQDDPEAEVRRRVVSQLQPPGATPDPVYGNPVDTAKPPAPPTGDSTPPAVTVNPVTPPAGGPTVTPQGDREPTAPPQGSSPTPTTPTAPTTPPATPPAGGPPVTPGFRDAVTALYQKYYQRNPTDAELQAHAGNPGGIDAVETMLRANGGGNATPTAPAPPGSDPASIIDALYTKFGIKDGGRGSGFADRAYWLEHPSEILNGRLAADLAGTGTDQPTGTPGTGPWQQSGRGQRGATGATGAQGATGLTAPTGFQTQSIGGNGQQSQGFWTPDFTNQIRQILLQRLQAAGQPVDENAPGIAGAVTAARDEATRQSTTERNALAERLYAQGGLNTNALTQQIQQSGERNASAVGSIRAQLIMKEVNQRRQELDSLLQMATASGDAESARQIQMQIALLNKQVQEEGLNLDAQKYSAYLNQNAAEAGLRG